MCAATTQRNFRTIARTSRPRTLGNIGCSSFAQRAFMRNIYKKKTQSAMNDGRTKCDVIRMQSRKGFDEYGPFWRKIKSRCKEHKGDIKRHTQRVGLSFSANIHNIYSSR